MNHPDARSLNPTIQDYLRQQAIRLREQGKRTGEIATYLGVHRTTVWEWWRQYQQMGAAALQQQQRGNKLGGGRTLTPGRIRLSKKNIKMIQTNELGIRDGGELNPIITGDKGFPSLPR